jgi:CubicO group peptidase (beta-lactamase class C family)
VRLVPRFLRLRVFFANSAVKSSCLPPKRVRRLLITGLFSVCFCGPSLGQSPDHKFDDYIQAYVHNGDFSGSVLIAKGDRIVFRKSYGMANYELSVPNTEKTRFHIASLSKTFTAAAIVRLEQKGKLKYSDALGQYIPGFLNGDRITIEQLLNHRSGIPDYYSLAEYPARKLQPVTLPDLIAWVKTKPLDFIPGTETRYSNTGYGFLAFIVEQVSGKSYEEFLRDEILAPAGMKSTGTFRDDVVIPDRATGYQPWTGTPPLRNAPYYDKTILTGSGSLYSTTGDLYAWYRALRDRKFFDLHILPSPYGWGSRETQGKKKYLEQDGRDPGFVSHLSMYFDEDLVVILLGNLEDAAVNTMAADLAALALGETASMPPSRPAAKTPVSQASEYTGVYEVNPNFLLDVRGNTSDLYLRGTGGDYLPLEHVGTDAFFYRQLYVKVNFRRDKTGKIEALLWNGDYPCKKISPQARP